MSNELTNRINNWMGQDDFFSNLGHSFFEGAKSFNQALKTDIKETDDAFDVKVDVPGINKEDISLSYDNGILSISAKRDSFEDESDKDGNIITSERSYGSYSRQYRLPNIIKDQISAKYTDGVLEITLPKSKKTSSSENQIKID
ncbi:Hsp20/alpha crystallin family protein [Liquorilactobacillus mali]|uniref:Heat shock protein Hsp20 n=1 Tax=Liquorilactobacillus mali KCTC 3596 = DSM 20444 TaxID=1046596 RepID=J0L3T3_9LACO|nr:Hsp20/alpha crystallin family protein [Liquorilactobacillus mali]EJE97918.1 heat shock protein Hsp20 [Liquorilactobacillus mali KCTC 3596 = DSM 20444]KRN08631.1 heat shock protein Hsp20 [Liquorilactobacillus mali KCTC 3596 = DSM 20444]MDV7758817.1 Hsp20 family protein [Liquorilactobacillus mali]QFQ75659.1 Hsp20/alpha crystallin family protein [Liquorilactobacillus mali]